MPDTVVAGNLQESTSRFADLDNVRSYILLLDTRNCCTVRWQFGEWTSIHLVVNKFHVNIYNQYISVIYSHDTYFSFSTHLRTGIAHFWGAFYFSSISRPRTLIFFYYQRRKRNVKGRRIQKCSVGDGASNIMPWIKYNNKIMMSLSIFPFHPFTGIANVAAFAFFFLYSYFSDFHVSFVFTVHRGWKVGL